MFSVNLDVVNLLHSCLFGTYLRYNNLDKVPQCSTFVFLSLYTLLHCRILARNASSSCHMIGQYFSCMQSNHPNA